ncbi:hypothetical protein GLOIN_2v1779223 [Rhizophagus clarus]|uniref:Uncharacterized protein n=1 Tax=Rhizophagus clarus TaxID=94130 RepID=A0A8H3M1S4_9GLOM|nr:hypothetical protein GLOIN_2v1779223 [Rhizophagus clarus]
MIRLFFPTKYFLFIRNNPDAVGEINYLDIQVLHKGKYRRLDFTESIDFIIVKTFKYPLVLGQSWLTVHEVNINLRRNEVSLYGMRIPFIDEDFYSDDDLYYEFHKLSGRSLPKSNYEENEYESSDSPSFESDFPIRDITKKNKRIMTSRAEY